MWNFQLFLLAGGGGGGSKGDCKAHTCGAVGPLDGRNCPCGCDILRPECENTCPK